MRLLLFTAFPLWGTASVTVVCALPQDSCSGVCFSDVTSVVIHIASSSLIIIIILRNIDRNFDRLPHWSSWKLSWGSSPTVFDQKRQISALSSNSSSSVATYEAKIAFSPPLSTTSETIGRLADRLQNTRSLSQGARGKRRQKNFESNVPLFSTTLVSHQS